MYKVFILETASGFAHAEVRRNGEFLTSARGATNAQALREIRRQVRVARHAGDWRLLRRPERRTRAPDPWADSAEFERTTYNSETHKPGNTRTVDDRGWILEDIRTST